MLVCVGFELEFITKINARFRYLKYFLSYSLLTSYFLLHLASTTIEVMQSKIEKC